MSQIERDVEQLFPEPGGWSFLDGLLFGAVVGALVAALVVLSRARVARRIAQRYNAHQARFSPGSGREASPL